MALHFILDGYNIIKKISSLAEMKLERSRETLVQFIENQKPQGSYKNEVTIVFDGQAGMYGGQMSSLVRVIFTCDETADEKIKRLVDEGKHKKSIVVVSDDRALRYYVRALGADLLTVEEFIKKGIQKDVTSQTLETAQPAKDNSKYISKSLEDKINKELEEIWIQKKEKSDKRPE